MKLLSVELKNIGPHACKTIGFTEPLTAIVGNNGSGKTFICESVVACLYGFFPTRPGSIYDRITNDYQGEASIEIKFEMDGEAYGAKRVLRRTGKTTSAEAKLLKITYDNDEDVYMDWLIAGPKITDFERAVVNLLGPADVFIASVFSSQQSTGDLCDARPGERKAVFAELLGLGRYDALSLKAKDRARETESEVLSQEQVIKGLKEAAGGVTGARSELARVEGQGGAEKLNLERHRVKIAELEAKVRDGEIALEKWKQADEQAQKLDREIKRIEGEVDADRKEYLRLKELAGKAGEVADAEAGIKTAQEEKDRLSGVIQEATENGASLRVVENKLSGWKLEKMGAQSQAGMLKGIPNEDCCKSCPLVEGAFKAQGKMAELEQKIELEQKEADGLKRLVDRDPLLMLNAKLEKAKDIIRRGEAVVASAAKIREAQGRMDAMAEAGVAKNEQIALKKEELEMLVAGMKAINCLPQIGTYKTALENMKKAERELERSLTDLISMIGALQERIRAIGEAEAKAEVLEAGIAGIRQMAEDSREIERAFGRSGIQPLLIEQARPELEGIANELLGRVSGEMSVRFQTQRELKSGEMAESLDIIITRDGAEQEIGEFSGGEQKIIKTVIRLTLAIWQARKAGSKLRTVIIDELMDALDAENSERILELIMSLQDQFDRVIIVSHDDALLVNVPYLITLG